nr:hypothetical protein BaRGS_002183 [Batillaria attramentaria]
MAYPGNYGLSSPGVGEDYDALAPDYEPDTLPYPRQRRSEADRDRVPPDQFDRNGYLADRRGSGEYDNRAFEGGGFEDRNMNMYNGQARHPTVSQMDRFDVIEVERDYDMDGRQDYRQPDNRREYDDMDDRQNYRQPDYRREYDDMDDRQNYRQPDYRREYDDMDDRHGYSPRDYHPHDAVEMAAGHYNPRNGVRHRGRHSAHGIENRAFTHDGEEVSDYHQVPRRRFSPRRTKSRRERRKSHRDRGRDRDLDTDHEDDRDSVDTIVPPDVTSEDYQRTMDFLATIRVKSRRKRKSLKRPHSDHIDHEAGQESEEDDDEEGEVGLPSQRAHPKPKSLTERLLEAKQQSTTEAANAIRSSSDFSPEKIYPKPEVAYVLSLSSAVHQRARDLGG